MEKCHICGFTCKSNVAEQLTMHYKNVHTHGDAIKQINFYNKMENMLKYSPFSHLFIH